jgi:hypothetical protein
MLILTFSSLVMYELQCTADPSQTYTTFLLPFRTPLFDSRAHLLQCQTADGSSAFPDVKQPGFCGRRDCVLDREPERWQGGEDMGVERCPGYRWRRQMMEIFQRLEVSKRP